MIRLNGSCARTLRSSQLLERAVVQEAGQVVGLGADLDGPVDLGVLEGDRDLRGEQLDELELLLAEALLDAEPLQRQHAGGAVAAAQRDARSGCRPCAPCRRNWLTRGSVRSSGTRAGSLCATTHVAMPVLAGLPRLEVLVGVDAARGQRDEQARRRGRAPRSRCCRSRRGRPAARRSCSRIARGSSVVRIDSVTRRSSRWFASWRSSASDWARRRLGRVGVGHRLGREPGVDHEQPQVVVGELVEPELGEHEHAEDLVLVEHRRQQHRLVEVVLGARDRVRPRVVGGVGQVLGDAVLGDPAGDPLADLRRASCSGVSSTYSPTWPRIATGTRSSPVEPVDADVVVVDQLAQLGRDRHARSRATVDSRDRRAPSCWIDWSWAAQVAIRSKFWAFWIATARLARRGRPSSRARRRSSRAARRGRRSAGRGSRRRRAAARVQIVSKPSWTTAARTSPPRGSSR